MTQTIIVLLIVAATVFFAVRRVVHTVRRKGGGCGCGCSDCPYKGGCNKKEAGT